MDQLKHGPRLLRDTRLVVLRRDQAVEPDRRAADLDRCRRRGRGSRPRSGCRDGNVPPRPGRWPPRRPLRAAGAPALALRSARRHQATAARDREAASRAPITSPTLRTITKFPGTIPAVGVDRIDPSGRRLRLHLSQVVISLCLKDEHSLGLPLELDDEVGFVVV
jgi:hypothetical protein